MGAREFVYVELSTKHEHLSQRGVKTMSFIPFSSGLAQFLID